MAKDKSPEVTVMLINDWYGPDGKFRRVTDNPHTVSGRVAEALPPTAKIRNDDGDFVKQPKREIPLAEPLDEDEKPTTKKPAAI